MNIDKINSCWIKQRKNKSGLKIEIGMTQKQMELFVIEKGLQPKMMIDIIVREVE